jgi:hypothetical protein
MGEMEEDVEGDSFWRLARRSDELAPAEAAMEFRNALCDDSSVPALRFACSTGKFSRFFYEKFSLSEEINVFQKTGLKIAELYTF